MCFTTPMKPTYDIYLFVQHTIIWHIPRVQQAYNLQTDFILEKVKQRWLVHCFNYHV